MSMQASQLIREGQYAAEVLIALHDDGGEWGLTVTPEDIQKLDRVRTALRAGDFKLAEQDAKVYRLVPYHADSRPAAGFGDNEQDGFQS
jgi:hypothetical protein